MQAGKYLSLFLLTSFSIVLSFAPTAYAGTLNEQLKMKAEAVQLIMGHLEIERDPTQNWQFIYGYGVTSGGDSRNLAVELSRVGAILTESSRKKSIADYERSGSKSGSTASELGIGRLGIEIKGTEYHHSFILGNHNETFRTFYMRFDESTAIESINTDTKDLLEVVILNFYTEKNVRQGIRIDKRSGRTVVTVSEQTIQGLLNSDLWPRSSKITLTTPVNQNDPKVDSQSHGL